MKTTLLLFAFLCLGTLMHSQENAEWDVKSVIEKKSGYGDYRGAAISGDGQTIVMGYPQYSPPDAETSNHGVIFTYKLDAGVWSEVGYSLDGEAVNWAFYGEELRLNYDGSILFTISPSADVSRGRIHAFQWNEHFWEDLGSPLWGEEYYSNYGAGFDMSNDGLRFMVSYGFYNPPDSEGLGQAEVYEFNDGDWELMGDPFVVSTDYKLSAEVAMSPEGSHVVIFKEFIDPGSGDYSPFLEVYQLNEDGSRQQIGDTVLGLSESDYASSLELSEGAERLIVGSSNAHSESTIACGLVEVYALDENEQSWWPHHRFYPELENAGIGDCLTINDKADVIVSKSAHNGSLIMTLFYSELQDEWTVLLQSYWTGIAMNTIQLAKDGTVLLEGFTGGEEVRLMEIMEVTGIDSQEELNRLAVFPNPTEGVLEFPSDHAAAGAVNIHDAHGRIVSTLPNVGHQIDVSFLDSGWYILSFEQNGILYRSKFQKI